MEENQSYSTVIGNPMMPFHNELASQYSVATNYFANIHPSIGDYFMLTTGKTITDQSEFAGTVPDDNIVRELVNAGKTWKVYAESLPSVGYVGGDVYPYVKRHNPFAYLSDVVGTPQQNNIDTLSQFSTDLASNALPAFSYVIANVNHDAHDCPNQTSPTGMIVCSDSEKLAAADSWLKANIEPLLTNSAFQQDGLLVILFDEAAMNDIRFGGGQVAMILAGPKVKHGYQSVTFYQHQSTLRMMLEVLGVNSFPGDSANAPDMTEFFQTQ
jgi:phospholipase C